jgi:hypothetical protein
VTPIMVMSTIVVLLADQRHAGMPWLDWGQLRLSPNLSGGLMRVLM